MKMVLIKKQSLFNLTLAFYDEKNYEKYKEFFKLPMSKKIISYFEEKNIFSKPFYEKLENGNLIYIIRNEDFNNNNYQLTKLTKPEKIDFSLINRVSYRGLDNVGATCYMNATLQYLANIKSITHHLLNPNR